MWRLVRLCAVLTGILFASEVVVLVAARFAYHDPFAPYHAIMPGNSVEALKDYPCLLQVEMNNATEFGWCALTLDESPFRRIDVFESNHVIARVDFIIVPYRFSLGDSILCWGKPFYLFDNYYQKDESYNLYWRNQVSARLNPGWFRAQPDYFLPITFLSIQREGRPAVLEEGLCASA